MNSPEVGQYWYCTFNDDPSQYTIWKILEIDKDEMVKERIVYSTNLAFEVGMESEERIENYKSMGSSGDYKLHKTYNSPLWKTLNE